MLSHAPQHLHYRVAEGFGHTQPEYASLRLSDRGFSGATEVVAKVGASSKLRVLLLSPFVGQLARQHELKLQLTVDQPLLAYQSVCNDAISVTNNFSSTCISSVYTSPVLFRTPMHLDLGT